MKSHETNNDQTKEGLDPREVVQKVVNELEKKNAATADIYIASLFLVG